MTPETHDYLNTVIVAPMTSKGRSAAFRIPVSLKLKQGLMVLDQIRTVDKARLVRKKGSVGEGRLC